MSQRFGVVKYNLGGLVPLIYHCYMAPKLQPPNDRVNSLKCLYINIIILWCVQIPVIITNQRFICINHHRCSVPYFGLCDLDVDIIIFNK